MGITSAGLQVTLCDPIWHECFRSSEAFANCYTRLLYLLYFICSHSYVHLYYTKYCDEYLFVVYENIRQIVREGDAAYLQHTTCCKDRTPRSSTSTTRGWVIAHTPDECSTRSRPASLLHMHMHVTYIGRHI